MQYDAAISYNDKLGNHFKSVGQGSRKATFQTYESSVLFDLLIYKKSKEIVGGLGCAGCAGNEGFRRLRGLSRLHGLQRLRGLRAVWENNGKPGNQVAMKSMPSSTFIC